MVHLINEINDIIFEELTINHNVKTNAKEISTLIKNEFLKNILMAILIVRAIK